MYDDEQTAANELFEQHRIKDPSPKILAALLNWYDINEYVEKIGMISPFEKKDLKHASYPLRLLGQCETFDESGERQTSILKDGHEILIKSNSIVFLTLEPLIQLPDYIAARFNLRVDLVYKGFLLGTGPLVDPGFIGRLSFPLHNLTTNDYTLRGGDKLVWMEFTKLSHHSAFKTGEYEPEVYEEMDNIPNRDFEFQFPKNVWGYMSESHAPLNQEGSSNKNSIRSSIPTALAQAEKSAKSAAKDAHDLTRFSAVAGVALLIAAAWFFFTISEAIEISHNSQAKMLIATEEINTKHKNEMAAMDSRIDTLAQRLNTIPSEATPNATEGEKASP